MKKCTTLACCMLTCIVIFAQPGSLDSTFSKDGKLKTTFGSYSNTATSVALQDDGKIIAAGFSYSGLNNDFALARCTEKGKIDSGFGANGKVLTDFGNDEYAYGVAVQADKKILVAGSMLVQTHAYIALCRYKQNGNPDSGFGKNGKVTTGFGNKNIRGNAICLQADGKIIVAGSSDDGTHADFALARYKSNGKLDSSFGVNGKVITDFGNNDHAESVVVQDNGKIVAAGYADNGTDNDFALARYKSNGNLDSTFGVNGKVVTDFGGTYDLAYDVALQADGKIVVGGWSGYTYDFALTRYKINGSLDSSFGMNGKAVNDLRGEDFGYSVAIQANGKIVVAGASALSDHDFALARYTVNGKLDKTFGDRGKVFTDFNNGDDYGEAIAIQPDGKIVVVGVAKNSFAVARYNGDSTVSGMTAEFSNQRRQRIGSSDIYITPNPVHEILHLQNLSSKTKTISVTNVTGKLVQQITTTDTNYSLDVKQLSAGLYFIRVDDGTCTVSKKFIKQ